MQSNGCNETNALITGSIARSAMHRYLIHSILRFFALQGWHIAPIGVKFGTEEGTVTNFTPIGATVRV